MKKSTLLSSLSLSLILLTSSSAHAYSVFFGEDLNNSSVTRAILTNSNSAHSAFVANLTSGYGTQDFETYAAGPIANSIPFPGVNPSLSATLTGVGTVVKTLTTTSSNLGRYSAPDGKAYWSVGLTSTTFFDISFNSAIAAFGFYGTDIGDFGGLPIIDIYSGNTLLQSYTVPATIKAVQTTGDTTVAGGTDGSALYYGFIANSTSELFTSVRFRSTLASATDVFGFDSFTIAEAAQLNTPLPSSQTPEPATMTLVGALLLGLGISRRRA
jgi:hypothetical protein